MQYPRLVVIHFITAGGSGGGGGGDRVLEVLEDRVKAIVSSKGFDVSGNFTGTQELRQDLRDLPILVPEFLRDLVPYRALELDFTVLEGGYEDRQLVLGEFFTRHVGYFDRVKVRVLCNDCGLEIWSGAKKLVWK